MANDTELKSTAALQRVIRESSDREVRLTIVREKKRETVILRW